MSQTFSDYAAAATSYMVALLTIFGTLAADNYGAIVQTLGFILLVARLIQELPRAATVIRRSFKRTTTTDTATTVTTIETTEKRRV